MKVEIYELPSENAWEVKVTFARWEVGEVYSLREVRTALLNLRSFGRGIFSLPASLTLEELAKVARAIEHNRSAA